MSLSKNYCLVLERFGKPIDVLKRACFDAKPVTGRLIKVRMLAAPINHADIAQIYGVYPMKIEPNSVPGNEGFCPIDHF